MPNKTLAVIATFLLTLIVANLFGERKTITGINEKKNNDAVKKETKKNENRNLERCDVPVLLAQWKKDNSGLFQVAQGTTVHPVMSVRIN